MTDYEYFLFYLRYKINDGVKQVAIAKSNKVKVSTAYINKLYKKPPSSCSQSIQDRIADFFGLTYEELVEESKILYRAHSQVENAIEKNRALSSLSSSAAKRKSAKVQPSGSEHEDSRDPLDLVNQLNSIANSIRANHDNSRKIEEERDDLLAMLTVVKTGICIVDEDLLVSFQNHEHKKMFGNKIGKPYTLFWLKKVGSNELTEKLFSEDYNGRIVSFEQKTYLINIIVKTKINNIKRVFEQVTCLDEQDANYFDSLNKQDQKITIYNNIFKYLDHGFGFFNNDRVLEIASNKFGLIDPKYNYPKIKPTVDQLLLDMGEKMKGGIKIVSSLKKAYENKEEINIQVVINGESYEFQTVDIKENDKSLGILLIVRKV